MLNFLTWRQIKEQGGKSSLGLLDEILFVLTKIGFGVRAVYNNGDNGIGVANLGDKTVIADHISAERAGFLGIKLIVNHVADSHGAVPLFHFVVLIISYLNVECNTFLC